MSYHDRIRTQSALAVVVTDAASSARRVGAATNNGVPTAGARARPQLIIACRTPVSQVRLVYFLLSRYVSTVLYNQNIVPTSRRIYVENEILSVDRGWF